MTKPEEGGKALDREGILRHFQECAPAYIDAAAARARDHFCLRHIPTANPERLMDAAWWLIQYCCRPRSVIDFGCGPGRLVKFFKIALDVRDYTGVEQVKDTIEQARQWYGGLDGVDFINHAIQDLDSVLDPDYKADLGFTHGVLMHVPPADIAEVVAMIEGRSRYQMIVEMTRSGGPGRDWAPHVFEHKYKELFQGDLLYQEWLTHEKRIFIFG